MEIMFQTTGRCNLDCWFCAYDYLPPKRRKELKRLKYPFEVFQKHVVKCLDYGFNVFHLTPIVGEPFLDKDIYKKIDFLHKFPGVERISIFTNFTAVDEVDIQGLMRFDKLALSISVYGVTAHDYVTTTRRSQEFFQVFVNNINHLIKHYNKNFKSIEMFVRCPWDRPHSHLKTMIKMIPHLKAHSDDYWSRNNLAFMDWNGNWCGLVPDKTFPNQRDDRKRHGICWFALIDNIISPNGDVGLCGACDVIQETIIGNINEQSFDEIYGKGSLFYKIIRNQELGKYYGCCKKCSEHHQPHPDSIIELGKRCKWFGK